MTAIAKDKLFFFAAFVALFLCTLFIGIKTDAIYLSLLPFVIVMVFVTLKNHEAVYFLLIFSLPLSIEYYFPNGLATDLPTEPLMIGLTAFTILLLSRKVKLLPPGFINHPLIILLIIHLMWYALTMINAVDNIVSFKILLAKIWYIVPFTFLTAIVYYKKNRFYLFFWLTFTPLFIEILLTNFRHGLLYGFSFDTINKCVTPYFRNHVNYAAMMSIFFPFLFLAKSWYRHKPFIRNFLWISIAVFVIAIYFSFTRTAMLAVLLMVPFYFIVKYNFARQIVAFGLVIVFIAGGYIFYDNNYLKFAPDFKETIYHDEFGDHLSSTFEGKDVSSMERIYRWVAAIRMTTDKPLMGVGPGGFYDNYKKFAVSSFETYISDNEERSTVHNYFLLLLCEQGVIGLLIFLSLTFAAFYYAQRAYNIATTRENKLLAMIVALVLMSVYVNLLLSDMMESDKVGPYYFMLLAFIVLMNNKQLTATPSSKTPV